MHKVNANDVAEMTWSSPRGKFSGAGKQISEALGRKRNSTDLLERHPFDLELARIPAGATPFPYHSHSAQWEFYYVLSGTGHFRHEGGTTPVEGGDALLFLPGDAHTMRADAQSDLVLIVIADNPFGESCHYPDSAKWAVCSPGSAIVRPEKPEELRAREATPLRKVSARDVAELSWTSPCGQYTGAGKQLSEALGRDPWSTDLFKRHPFDVELGRTPAGATAFGYHSHSAQWEFYYVLSGSGSVRHAGGTAPLAPGDAVLFKPGEAHALTADAHAELTLMVVADNPLGETYHFPDSGTWTVLSPQKVNALSGKLDYYDGEE